MSAAEDQLAFQLDAVGIKYEREVRFAPPRRWRLDFLILGADVAVEVEGGAFVQGRHTRGSGFLADCEKYAEAVARGIRLLRVAPNHVKDGRALQWIEKALAFRPEAQR